MGDFTLADPAACLRARRARLAALQPDAADPVRQAADRILSGMRDTMPTLQSLTVDVVPPGRSELGFGTGIPLTEGRPVPTGVVVYGAGVYVGIARPDATHITHRPARHNGHAPRRRRRPPSDHATN
jgi:hypothetical protein